MNWRNILLLVSVNAKSSRLLGGGGFRRFKENRLFTYMLYLGVCVLGSLFGWFFGSFYGGLIDAQVRMHVLSAAKSFYASFPTLALLYTLILTQMSQLQRIRVKAQVQPLYWLPITWEEHTLASIIASILGSPLATTLFIAFAVITASIPIGLICMTPIMIFALFPCVFMASATTEITKILYVRVSGAINRMAGRMAIWIRLVGSIIFFAIFYMIYFLLCYRRNLIVLLEAVSAGQRVLWFIPYLWPGIALSSFADGRVLEAVLFSSMSAAFSYLLFLLATKLNFRYGLYEAPAIKVSTGIHISKAGLLGRLGFSPAETAIIRKDFKAFTRRQDMVYILILPVVFAIVPVLSAVWAEPNIAASGNSRPIRLFLSAFLTLIPGLIVSMEIGTRMIGLEGSSVWYIYSSPIDARSLVRAKYAITVLLSFAAMVVSSMIGYAFFASSASVAILSVAEAVLLILSISMVSLSFGIRGADFRELPKPRMIRTKWAIIGGLTCLVLAAVTVLPGILYALSFIIQIVPTVKALIFPSEVYLFAALSTSGILAFAITYEFYRTAIKYAEEFLASPEEKVNVPL